MMQNSDWVFLTGKLTSIQDIDAALSASEDDFHGTAKGYVARISCAVFEEVSQPSLLANNNEWKNIARRLNGRNLVLLLALPSPYDLAIQPRHVNLINVGPFKYMALPDGDYQITTIDPDELDSLRDSELCRVVANHSRRAILTVSDGHFELPSGAHTSHFFRLAECLASTGDIDSLVYWVVFDFGRMLSKTVDGSGTMLIVDNPSMLILGVRLVQLFPQYRIACECLTAYPDARNAADDMDDWLGRNLRDATQVYWLVGVSSTGNLTIAIDNACKRLGLGFGSSVIYSTTPGLSGKAYCDLQIDGYQHFANEAVCELCNSPSGNGLFQIDKARYFVSERSVNKTSLPPKLFQLQKKFISEYGANEGVLLAHIDSPNDGAPRHHAFYIDVNKLLDLEKFRKELIEKINTIVPKPNLVIIPPHEAGKKIADLLRVEFDLLIHFHNNLRIDTTTKEGKDLANALNSAESLLIIDDLAFTGNRLQIFNRSLRESGASFKAPSNVVFFPLIALPEDFQRWERLERGIVTEHPGQVRKVIFLHKFILPHWGSNHCPWCTEAKQIEKLDVFGESDSDRRGVRLGDKKNGLNQEVWVNHDDATKVPSFGAQSPVLDGGSTSMQMLFTCASAVQQARVGYLPNLKLDPNGFPKSTVLDSAVVRDLYTETLILVSLLRCLLRDEVDNQFKKFVTDRVLSIFQNLDPHDHWALRELLLASKRGLALHIEDKLLREQVYAAANFSEFADI